MNDLNTRLANHIAQMAPHQKERHGGKLLVESRYRIGELEELAVEAYHALNETCHEQIRKKISETLKLKAKL